MRHGSHLELGSMPSGFCILLNILVRGCVCGHGFRLEVSTIFETDQMVQIEASWTGLRSLQFDFRDFLVLTVQFGTWN